MSMAPGPRRWPLHAGLLAVWFAASFGVIFFARDLQHLRKLVAGRLGA